VSPTVFRHGRFRFFFFSREEPRIHIHVDAPDGEAKFWLEPRVELAKGYRLRRRELEMLRRLILDRESEIRDAWHRHFGS
jgi:hypothetical protein